MTTDLAELFRLKRTDDVDHAGEGPTPGSDAPRPGGIVIIETVLPYVLLLAAMAQAWFPFRADIPVTHRSAPTEAIDNSLSFDGSDALVSNDPQRWVSEARRGSELHVKIVARTASADQDGPARLLSVSRSVDQTNLTIGQEGSTLVVRLRRPTSNELGEPALEVDGVFADDRWHTVELDVDRHLIELRVDGALRVQEETDSAPLSSWDPSYRTALGDDIAGDRAWRGSLSEATVSLGALRLPSPGTGEFGEAQPRADTPDATVDLLAPGTLQGADDFVVASRLSDVFRVAPTDTWPISVARMAAFAVLGLVVAQRWPSRRTWKALVAFPVVLSAGKLFIATRDPAVADALLGVAGIGVAALIMSRRRPPQRAQRRPSPADRLLDSGG